MKTADSQKLSFIIFILIAFIWAYGVKSILRERNVYKTPAPLVGSSQVFTHGLVKISVYTPRYLSNAVWEKDVFSPARSYLPSQKVEQKTANENSEKTKRIAAENIVISSIVRSESISLAELTIDGQPFKGSEGDVLPNGITIIKIDNADIVVKGGSNFYRIKSRNELLPENAIQIIK